MKAAFAQFLNLRHGGHRQLLLSAPIPERPFHSLSYPDINYTVMRPATLPPASTTYNPGASGYNSATYTGDPGVRNPYIYPPAPASIGATGAANTVFASGSSVQRSYEQRHPAAADPGAAAVPDSRRLHERRRRHLPANAAHGGLDGQQRQRLRRPVHQCRTGGWGFGVLWGRGRLLPQQRLPESCLVG